MPLAHGLGFDALVLCSGAAGRQRKASRNAFPDQAHNGSINERITPSLENRALRLYFPEEYSMIEADGRHVMVKVRLKNEVAV